MKYIIYDSHRYMTMFRGIQTNFIQNDELWKNQGMLHQLEINLKYIKFMYDEAMEQTNRKLNLVTALSTLLPQNHTHIDHSHSHQLQLSWQKRGSWKTRGKEKTISI